MPQSQSFQPEPIITKIPTRIGALGIMFFKGDANLIPELRGEDGEIIEAALYDYLAVMDQNGEVMNWHRGDLVPELTPQEIQWLRNLMDRLLAEADNRIIP